MPCQLFEKRFVASSCTPLYVPRWLRRRELLRVVEREDLLHDPFAGIADAVRAVVGAEEVFDDASVVAIDALHADREVRHHLALGAEDELVEVLIADVRIGRLGEAAEDRRRRAEVRFRGGIGRDARRTVVDDARLPLVREGADDEVHRDLFVELSVRSVDLHLMDAARIPDEAEARREVLLHVDLRDARGVDDLLAVPAHAVGHDEAVRSRSSDPADTRS